MSVFLAQEGLACEESSEESTEEEDEREVEASTRLRLTPTPAEVVELMGPCEGGHELNATDPTV
jgi:hypothetical protein